MYVRVIGDELGARTSRRGELGTQRERPHVLLLDLFGTLVEPPTEAWVRAGMLREGFDLPDPLNPAVFKGFPLSLVLHEMCLSPEDLLLSHLTSQVSRPEELVALALAKHPTARSPSATALEATRRLIRVCVEGCVLRDDARTLLASWADREVHIVSDLGAGFGEVIPRLGLDRWCTTAHLSFQTGQLKRDGTAFGPWRGRAPGTVLMVGDNWQSDVLGALRAGLGAAFLDRSGQHPIRHLLKDARCALSVDADGRISVGADNLPLIDFFVPGGAAEIEREPMRHLMRRPDDTVAWTAFERVDVLSSLDELVDTGDPASC